MFSIGRCGSTLVSRMLETLPGTWSLSEPTACFELAMRGPRWKPAEAERLIAAVMRLSLRPPRGAAVRRFAVKFHSQVLPQAELYHRAFPGAVFLFLYREAESWVQSGHRFEQKLGHDVAPRDWEAMRWHWWIWSAAADPALLARHVELSRTVHLEALIAAAWICHIDSYLEARARGVPFHAFRYDELNDGARKRRPAPRRLRCPPGHAPAMLAAYAGIRRRDGGRPRPAARGLDGRGAGAGPQGARGPARSRGRPGQACRCRRARASAVDWRRTRHRGIFFFTARRARLAEKGRSSRRQELHRITVVTLLARPGRRGLRRRQSAAGDERPADGPRSAAGPQAASFAAWRDGVPRPGAGRRASGPRCSTRPSPASASTPRWCGSTAGRPSSPSRSGSISTAPPRPTGSRPAGPRGAQLDPTLAAIERRYGVDGEVVLAIWGMETNYGGNRGSMPVIESLATLAYEGRRRDFAEEQLIAALRILQAGDVDAGAHGRLLGRRDGPHPVHADELSSTTRSTSPATAAATSGRTTRPTRWPRRPTTWPTAGWRRGQPWGIEVRLPRGLQLRLGRPVEPPARSRDWRARGVTLGSTARPLPDHGPAAIIAPAGARGPAFAVYENFFVIKKYNNATSYAMGVGHLGDRIAGGGADRRRLAARRARAVAHREDRAAGAADRARLSRPARPTA